MFFFLSIFINNIVKLELLRQNKENFFWSDNFATCDQAGVGRKLTKCNFFVTFF